MKINHDVIRKISLLKNLKRLKQQRNIIGYAWNRFQWHWYPRLFVVRPYPIHIDIELTSNCQLKCPMCFRQHRKIDNVGDMSFDLFKKIIDEIDGKVFSIKFTGRGEPLMHKEFPVFIKYLKKKSFGEIAMITNGLLMTEEIIRCIIENNMDFVSYSIDGLMEQYEKIRKPGKYNKIQATVRSHHNMRLKMNSNKPLIRIQSVKMDTKDETKYLNIWDPISDDIFFLHFKDYSTTAKNKQMAHYTCPLLYQRIMIHYDGTVPMCINDEYEEAIMGNVGEKSVQKIWLGKSFNEARDIQKSGARTNNYKNCFRCALTRVGHGK